MHRHPSSEQNFTFCGVANLAALPLLHPSSPVIVQRIFLDVCHVFCCVLFPVFSILRTGLIILVGGGPPARQAVWTVGMASQPPLTVRITGEMYGFVVLSSCSAGSIGVADTAPCTQLVYPTRLRTSPVM